MFQGRIESRNVFMKRVPFYTEPNRNQILEKRNNLF